jgi:hypothetical protein
MDNERLITIILISIVWAGFAVMLVRKEDGLPSAVLQSLLLFYWSYMGHVYAHHASLKYPFNIINNHVSIHHEKVDGIPRWLELMLEAINNFMGFFVLYLGQKLIGIKVFNLKSILYAAFLFIGIHIFYYSVLTDNKYHRVHHDDPFHNYSPELFDIIFNTRRYDKQYDKISFIHEVLPALISYYLVIYIFKFFK